MDKAFPAVLAALAAGFFGTLFGDLIMFRELGPIAAIAVMGGFIIYFSETKK